MDFTEDSFSCEHRYSVIDVFHISGILITGELIVKNYFAVFENDITFVPSPSVAEDRHRANASLLRNLPHGSKIEGKKRISVQHKKPRFQQPKVGNEAKRTTSTSEGVAFIGIGDGQTELRAIANCGLDHASAVSY